MHYLTELEREALEGWMPAHAQVLAVARGRRTADGDPVWVLTSNGLIVVTFSTDGQQHLRARVQWTPPYSLYRLDLLDEATHALLRVVTHHRRHVLLAVSAPEARHFAAQARGLIVQSLRRPSRDRGALDGERAASVHAGVA